MSYSIGSSAAIGSSVGNGSNGRGRGRGRGRNGGRGTGRNDDERNESDRNEFIASFQLNMLTSSSPILVRNDIRKLGDNCYSARLIREYFQNTNPHNVNMRIKQIWKVCLKLMRRLKHFNLYRESSFFSNRCTMWAIMYSLCGATMTRSIICCCGMERPEITWSAYCRIV